MTIYPVHVNLTVSDDIAALYIINVTFSYYEKYYI